MADPPPPLTLLSWNLQLLSPQAQKRKARAVAAASRILALSPRPQVVCLQEVWCPKARALLLSVLSMGYAHVFCPAATAKCGLLIASVHPLSNCTFMQFEGAMGMERRVFQKGAAGVLVNLAGGERVCVLNTHLQSDFWTSGQPARCLQVNELAQFARRMALDAEAVDGGDACCGGGGGGAPSPVRTLLVGDLNIAAGSQECKIAMALLDGMVDTMAEPAEGGERAAHTFPLGIWKRGQKKYALRSPSVRLDYVLQSKETAAGSRAKVDVALAMKDGLPLSDHAPLMLTA